MSNAEPIGATASAASRSDPASARAAQSAAQTADQLTRRNVRTIAQLEDAARLSNGLGQRIAGYVAAFCGSMTFVWIHVAWFGGWIFVNTSSAFAQHADPFPFTFLTLMVSLEAIFLSAFILMSQNQENRLTEQRSHLDLQINLLAEQENTKMLRMLQAIAEKIGADIGPEEPDLAVLQETTRPDRLLDQIEETTRVTDRQPRS